MKHIKNVSIDNTSARAYVMRDGERRTRRFLFTKFGGKSLAIKKAQDHVRYLNNCTDYQFENALRSPGRPFQSEYFGRRIIAN